MKFANNPVGSRGSGSLWSINYLHNYISVQDSLGCASEHLGIIVHIIFTSSQNLPPASQAFKMVQYISIYFAWGTVMEETQDLPGASFSPSRGSDNCGGPALIRGFNSSSSEPFMPRRWRCFSSIKGPESPTSQLLPISRSTSCSGTGKERQRRWWRIEKLQKIVCEELCVIKLCERCV